MSTEAGTRRAPVEVLSKSIVYGHVPEANTTCPICRNLLGGPCIECTNGVCNVSHGACGHAYHTCCIDRYHRSRDDCLCLMDNAPFQVVRIDKGESIH